MAYDIVKSEKIYKGRVFDIVKDTITLPDGNVAEKEIVCHNGSVGILAIDDDGKILLVRQYRHSAKKETLEIPAGTIEKGENPYDCAVRELEEETGCKCGKMEYFFKFYSAIGFCSEILYIYIADGLSEGVLNLDCDEFINTERYTVDEAVKMIFSGEICDSKTIASILAYKEKLDTPYNNV